MKKAIKLKAIFWMALVCSSDNTKPKKKLDLASLPYAQILRLLNRYQRDKLKPLAKEASECPESYKKVVCKVKELSHEFKNNFDPFIN